VKRLPLVILVFAVLVAVVAGCSHSARYDARLTSADSLMRDCPDSTLAIVEGLCRDSLATEGDRAYRDLLLTQARYRCYITATSDSDINRALAYYRAHPKEREKLTRANIYKGAVMHELGFPDSAMLYYKHAEAVADTADYFNLGYVNLRISCLFLDQVSKDSSVIVRLHRAIRYFEKLQDTTRLLQVLGNLASFTGYSQPDSAKQYLWRAIELARRFDPTQQYTHESTLAGVYFFQNEFAEANALAMDVLRHGSEYSLETQFYYYAAMSYIRLGKLDSAKYVLNVTPAPEDEVDSLTYYNLTAEISKAEGKPDISVDKMSQSKELLGNILFSSREAELLQIDSEFDRKQEELHHDKVNRRNITIISIGLILLILLSFIIYRNKHRYSQLIKDLMEESQNHVSDINTLRRNIDQLKIRDSQLKDFITSYIELMGDVTKACYHSPKNVLSNEISRLFQIKEENKDRWVELYSYIDNEYNQIITDTINKYNQLNDRDILLLALTCLDFSCAQIAIITGYSNATSISGNRQRLAKKMGLDHSLQEYINQYKSPQEAN